MKRVQFGFMTRDKASKVIEHERDKLRNIRRGLHQIGRLKGEIDFLIRREAIYVATHLQRTPTEWCIKLFNQVILDDGA